MFGSKRKREKQESAQVDERLRQLNAQSKAATLSAYPPHEREAAWERMQARRLGVSVAAYRARQGRR
jgi:hypothetical protein